ncbi:sigma 54-interacting transcriptional regulator, partial [Acinetobacter sp. 163]|nr:sigma 54-interacting transcriptional regulator [Acinetobacter sp. 163]
MDLQSGKTKSKKKSSGIRKYTFDNIIGESEAIQKQINIAKKAAKTNATVFIYGETGTGKELFAQSIHYEGVRRNGPFLAQNCAALS